MGIFGQSTPFDADVEKTTSETNTNEDWALILDVCDKVTSNPRNAKECLKSIMKRMGHADPHVVMQALTLLDACCNNCGKAFHLEVASREFENEYRRLLSKAQPQVSSKMRQILKNWAEKDFKNDPQLNLIPSFYHKLKSEGYDFSNLNEKSTKSATTIAALKDPNVVNSQQEEDDIAKAIELSLKETKNSPKKLLSTSSSAPSSSSSSLSYPSLYPSLSSTSTSLGNITSSTVPQAQPEPRKVRALYDFEAAEENELTFLAGEIIYVIDDSDPNWWKGYNSRGEGLFPSNFATADLSVETDRVGNSQKSKRYVTFEDESNKSNRETENDIDSSSNPTSDTLNVAVEIDETKIDRLLHLLHEANPEDPSQDTEEMLRLEREVNQMGPLIDAELERVDRKHAQLTQLSSDLVDAINLYHTLMRDDRSAIPTTYMPGMPTPAAAAPPQPQTIPQSTAYNQQAMLFGYSPFMAPGHNQQGLFHMPAGPVSSSSVHQYPPINTVNTQSQIIPQTLHNVPMPISGNNAGGAPPPFSPQMQGSPQMIPIHFQNGRLSGSQMNGTAVASGTQQPSQHMYTAAQQPLQQHQSQIVANQSRQQHLGQTSSTMAPQQPIPQQSAVGQFMHQSQQQPYVPSSMRQPFSTTISNGQYMTSGPSVSGAGAALPTDPMLQMLQHQAPLPPHQNNDFSRQIAASMNQPVTQNFLMQNEPKNIPIYQQQR